MMGCTVHSQPKYFEGQPKYMLLQLVTQQHVLKYPDSQLQMCYASGNQNMLCQAILSRVVRKPFFAYVKTKTQISFAVTAKLISAFVFAT